MPRQRTHSPERRQFLSRVSALSLAGLYASLAAAEGPPETRRLRILYDPRLPILCYGPQYVALEFLRQEGFEEVSYAAFGPDFSDAAVLAAGEADITAGWAGDFLLARDRDAPVVCLSGLHTGCSEIFARKQVQGFSDLRGKRVAILAHGSPEEVWFSMMVGYIGIDASRDIEFVTMPYEEWEPAFVAGDVDAVLLWPPDSLYFRERGIGHVILNTRTDRPWSDYFCCMIGANQGFAENHPNATKRALRAMLKAADLCARDPETAARTMAESGLDFDLQRSLDVFSANSYGVWRDYEPEDTLRFFALRLRDIGRLRKTPDVLVEEGSDWRFLESLRRELKA